MLLYEESRGNVICYHLYVESEKTNMISLIWNLKISTNELLLQKKTDSHRIRRKTNMVAKWQGGVN